MVSRGIKSRQSEMTIQLDEENGGKVLAVHVSGKLAKADYERFVPAFERLLRQAAWFAMHHFDDIERIGMVGEKRWQNGMGSICKMASFCKPFTKATVRYVDRIDASEAQTWLDDA
jgi:hypothetical protein